MTIRTVCFLLLSFVLVGCGTGSNSTPPPVPTTSVSGISFDAPIQNGVVKVYSFDGGQVGAMLATGSTDSQGNFSVSVQSQSLPILIEITGGRYVEEASGQLIDLQRGQVLYAVKNLVMQQPLSVTLSYYTTLATGYAQYLINKGVAVGDAIDQANTQLSNLPGFDVVVTQPLDITDPANATPWLTAGHEYGFSLAALSGWTWDASKTNGAADQSLYNSIRFIQVAYDDIRADGMLDGKGASGALAMGVIPLSTRVYRHELAIQMLNVAAGSENRTGLAAVQVVDAAKRLNDSTSAVFGPDPTVPLSEGGPVISDFSIKNGAPLSGVVNFKSQVTSAIPLASVELIIDSLAPFPGDPATPSFAIDTRTLADGIHTLTILATDVAGVSSNSSVQVLVDNTPPQAFNRTAVANGTFYGTYTESGSGIAQIWVVWSDGVLANATATPTSSTGGTWSVPVRFGLSWSLHATDLAGNSCTPTPADTTNCQ